MDHERLEHHLRSPQGAGHVPPGGVEAMAGGGTCCDSVALTLAVRGDRVVDAGFRVEGCGTAHAAGSASVALVRGAKLLDAARIGVAEIAAELGGLSPGKLHAAELAADALHRALGEAAVTQAEIGLAPGRLLVAMSGGVDSAVAALRCARGGAEVVAVTLELWADAENDGERSCCSASAVRFARALAHRMGLPHLTVDLRDAFRAGVVEPFLDSHAAGETPNPCVGCNGRVRLDAMLALAERLGCSRLATGHYARVVPGRGEEGPLLRLARDPGKDQAYMLAGLSPDSLARMRFPLGELTKAAVRAIAAEAELPVAAKADSQDLCFLAGTGRARFLERHGGPRLARRAGSLVDLTGREVGVHDGQHRFTVGQRRGLGLDGGSGEPLYVLARDPVGNRVTVGPRSALETSEVMVRDVVLHRDAARVNAVKLRYRMAPLAARLAGPDGDSLTPGTHATATVLLGEATDRPAPGQLACLLDGELVVGRATVTT